MRVLIEVDEGRMSPPCPQLPEPASDSVRQSWATRPTFAAVTGLGIRYYARISNQGRHPAEVIARAQAVVRLLRQLDFVVKSAYVLNDHWARFSFLDEVTQADIESADYSRFVLDIYTETFYYLGHRLQKILGSTRCAMPYVSGYVDAKGVRTIRNRFLEHPPESSTRAAFGASYSPHHGPAAMRDRLSGDSRPKLHGGLFPDAEELIDTVTRTLSAAHSLLDAEGPDTSSVSYDPRASSND